jgi:hypothetical protein
MKQYIFLMIFFLGFLSANAQNYVPGFVVDNSGDTLKGFIDDKRWDSSPSKISFRRDPTAVTLEYEPVNIRAFSVGGEFYESAIVDVDTSPAKLEKLNDNRAPSFVKSTVFLQIIFKGNKILALYKDQMSKNLFYIKVDGKFQPLVYKQYIANAATRSIGENNDYKGMLNIYLNDCPKTMEILSGARYTVNSMVKLFKGYYECKGQSAQYIDERKDVKTEFGITLGAAIASIGFTPSVVGYPYLTSGSFSTSTGPAIGVYFDFKLLRSNRFKISNDLFYTSFNITGTGIVPQSNPPGTTAQVDMQFNYSYIKTHDLLRYDLVKGGAFYAAGGFTVGLALSSDAKVTSTYTLPPFEVKSLELGYVGGLGGRLGKFNLEGRYEYGSGISDIKSQTLRYYFLLRYRLSKT